MKQRREESFSAQKFTPSPSNVFLSVSNEGVSLGASSWGWSISRSPSVRDHEQAVSLLQDCPPACLASLVLGPDLVHLVVEWSVTECMKQKKYTWDLSNQLYVTPVPEGNTL